MIRCETKRYDTLTRTEKARKADGVVSRLHVTENEK